MSRWSEEQLAFLREHMPTHGAAWCAEQLGRTARAIYQVRRKYDLPYSKRGVAEGCYSPDEEAAIRATPTSYRCVQELARQLGRSYQSVKVKRYKLRHPEAHERIKASQRERARARKQGAGAALPKRWSRSMDALLHGLRAPLAQGATA